MSPRLVSNTTDCMTEKWPSTKVQGEIKILKMESPFHAVHNSEHGHDALVQSRCHRRLKYRCDTDQSESRDNTVWPPDGPDNRLVAFRCMDNHRFPFDRAKHFESGICMYFPAILWFLIDYNAHPRLVNVCLHLCVSAQFGVSRSVTSWRSYPYTVFELRCHQCPLESLGMQLYAQLASIGVLTMMLFVRCE
jgi:hypothetical protein